MDEAGDGGAELLARVRDGDEDAARALVLRLRPHVERIVRAHGPRRVALDDLCQEVFMSVFANLAQHRGAAPFEHWVARVAVHTCIDALRAERRRPELRWADLREAEAAALEAMLENTQQVPAEQAVAARDLVERLLESLPAKDRLLIRWLELEEQSVAEVAALTGWSRTLVKVRAFRARQRMRQTLKRLEKR